MYQQILDAKASNPNKYKKRKLSTSIAQSPNDSKDDDYTITILESPRSISDTSTLTATTTTSSLSQHTMQNYLLKNNDQYIIDTAVLAFTMNSISHQVIDQPHFRQFIRALKQYNGNLNVLNRKSLRKNVIIKAKEYHKVFACVMCCVLNEMYVDVSDMYGVYMRYVSCIRKFFHVSATVHTQ